jgi:hypothetical protein
MTFTEIVQNPHFQQIAARIRGPWRSSAWQARHPEVPIMLLIDNARKAMPLDVDWTPNIREAIVEAWTKLLAAIANADERLYYTPEDMDWLITAIESEYAKATLSMLLAYASAPTELLTPAEIAEMTGTNESTWRNNAAAGKIPGAVKKGKQWLIPQSAIA